MKEQPTIPVDSGANGPGTCRANKPLQTGRHCMENKHEVKYPRLSGYEGYYKWCFIFRRAEMEEKIKAALPPELREMLDEVINMHRAEEAQDVLKQEGLIP